jgi:BirA family transcriptional regulator, biotin operon repressor / biotin---[acetyl-CoA-carboxylase] ligase
LSAEVWPKGVGRLILETVDSTNAHAARLADTLPAPFWVMAREQTGGRGRRGRPWISPPGNLYATCLMRPTEAADRVALRSFAAALALHDACTALTGRPEALALKWPNDVLLNGGKLAGILLEAQGTGGAVGHLAIGIGVNLASAPPAGSVEPGALPPVSLLGETGLTVSPEEFLDLLAPALTRWEACFVTQGFAPLRAAWLARAARLGQAMRARTGQADHHGIFETVDASGALVLRTGTGPLAIAAAEVFF